MIAPTTDGEVLNTEINHKNASGSTAILTSTSNAEIIAPTTDVTLNTEMNRKNASRRSSLLSSISEIIAPTTDVKKHESSSDGCGNDPHEALEFPPLYFLFNKWPSLLQGLKYLYKCRWSVTYPLQRRIPLRSELFHKANISSVTYGEILWILPFVTIFVFGMMASFLKPNVFYSGHLARLPLAIAIVTASRNSIVTFLFGVPFERCLFYHKLAGRLAFINGIFHTFVTFVYPYPGAIHGPPSEHTLQGENPNFFLFAFDGLFNISGTSIFLLILAIIITSLPKVRERLFHVFQFLHLLFVWGMVCCAFYHSGSFLIILASVSYGGDLLIRKILMACILYPKEARIRKLTDTVIEISFRKTKNINYNAGQYILIAVPQLSFFEWHPFSISSSPHQDVVTLNIRVCGDWTKQLMKLAEKSDSIEMLLEGPYGSLGVDLMSKNRYKMVMFVSGGIGVTPMQSICHQLMYEHAAEKRELKRVWFLWTARDPHILENMEVAKRQIALRDRPGRLSAIQKFQKRLSMGSIFRSRKAPLAAAPAAANIPRTQVTFSKQQSVGSIEAEAANFAGPDSPVRQSANKKFAKRSMGSILRSPNAPVTSAPSAASMPRTQVTFPIRQSVGSVVSQLSEGEDANFSGTPEALLSVPRLARSACVRHGAPFSSSFQVMKRTHHGSIMGGTLIRDTQEAHQMRKSSWNGITSESSIHSGDDAVSMELSFSRSIACMLLTEHAPNIHPLKEWNDFFSTAENDSSNAMWYSTRDFLNRSSCVTIGADLARSENTTSIASYKVGQGPTLDANLLKHSEIAVQRSMGATPHEIKKSDTSIENGMPRDNGRTYQAGQNLSQHSPGLPDCDNASFYTREHLQDIDTETSSSPAKIDEYPKTVRSLSISPAILVPSPLATSVEMLLNESDAGLSLAKTPRTFHNTNVSATANAAKNLNNNELDDGVLRLELFLSGGASRDGLAVDPFLSSGRPDFKKTFQLMREEAIRMDEKRIAVCVCGPKIVVKLCKIACSEYSDQLVRFDFHSETFG